MTIRLERRLGGERRHRDVGPPAGWSERRRSVERRQPEVGLSEISDGDWEKYFGSVVRPGAIREGVDGTHFDAAAAVFERARD